MHRVAQHNGRRQSRCHRLRRLGVQSEAQSHVPRLSCRRRLRRLGAQSELSRYRFRRRLHDVRIMMIVTLLHSLQLLRMMEAAWLNGLPQSLRMGVCGEL